MGGNFAQSECEASASYVFEISPNVTNLVVAGNHDHEQERVRRALAHFRLEDFCCRRKTYPAKRVLRD